MDSGNPEHHPSPGLTGARVAEKARELIGSPYLHQGRTPHGIDCVGVPIWVMQQLDIMPSGLKVANYGRIATGELIERCQQYGTRLEGPELGCLICFRWPGEREAGHVAIKTAYGMVHAYVNHKGVKEHGYREPWLRWTDSFWRLPGVSG